MSTNFFKRTKAHVLPAPPPSIEDVNSRARFTTEEYWNSISVPTTLNNLGGVKINRSAIGMPFGVSSQGTVVTQPIEDGSSIKTVKHAVLNPVQTR